MGGLEAERATHLPQHDIPKRGRGVRKSSLHKKVGGNHDPKDAAVAYCLMLSRHFFISVVVIS